MIIFCHNIVKILNNHMYSMINNLKVMKFHKENKSIYKRMILIKVWINWTLNLLNSNSLLMIIKWDLLINRIDLKPFNSSQLIIHLITPPIKHKKILKKYWPLIMILSNGFRDLPLIWSFRLKKLNNSLIIFEL